MTIDQHLHTLETAELIRQAALAPELAYLFRHALVQEAAYGSLVRADRKRLHRAAGEALEAMYTATEQPVSAEVAALLARHFHIASEPRAQQYAEQAGAAALARYANTEAISYYSLALEWARQGADGTALGPLYTARGRALELNGEFAEALGNYQTLEAEGRARGDEALVLLGLVNAGRIRSNVNTMFNPAEGFRLAAEALALAEQLNDTAAQARIHWNLLNLNRFATNFKAARDSGERSLALAQGQVEQEAATLNDIMHVYAALGAWPEHQSAAAGATERWRALGNLPMLADSLATTSMYAAMRGDYDLTLASSREASQIAQAINNQWGKAYSLSGVGMAHWYRGEYATALRACRECLRLAEPSGFLIASALIGSEMAALLIDMGQPQAALEAGREAVECAQQNFPPLLPQCVGVVALAQMALGQLAAAAQTLTDVPLAKLNDVRWMANQVWRAHVTLAIEQRSPEALPMAQTQVDLLRDYLVPPLLVEARLLLAQAQRQAGQREAAREALLAARAGAQELTLRRLWWPVCAELAGLAAEAGDDEAAGRWRAEAEAVVAEIAAEMTAPEMRAGFEAYVAGVLAERGTAMQEPEKTPSERAAKKAATKRSATAPGRKAKH